MEGVPEDVLQAHQQRVAAQYHQAEAERQAVTGNPPSGTGAGGQPNKKPKLEDVSDIKARLAAHRAKRAEAAAGGSSGEATPLGAGQSASTPTSYVRYPFLRRYILVKTNGFFPGTTTRYGFTSIATAAPSAAHISPTVRRRPSPCSPCRSPLSTTDCQPSLPGILPTWCCFLRSFPDWCYTLSSRRLSSSTIPRPACRTRLWGYSASLPPATNTSDRHRPSSSTRQPAATRRPPTTTCIRRPSHQRATDATDAHGPPGPAYNCDWLHQWQCNSNTRTDLVIR